jgi:hypothetical protein
MQECGIYFTTSGVDPVVGSLKCDNEPSGSIKDGEFLD